MNLSRTLLLAPALLAPGLLAATAPALLLPMPTFARPPVLLGANLPQVNRYSKDGEWGEAGGLAGWALKGKAVRVAAVPWAAWPDGFRGGQVDTLQIYRQMEVAKSSAQVLVLLSPSEWTKTGQWVPPKEDWPAAISATKRMIAEYDAGAKKFGLKPPQYQLWNETSPGKPGGAKSGPPGQFDPALHEYLAALTKGLGITDATAKRFVSPALSNLTDAPEAARGELASCSSKDGTWEHRVGAIAVHLRFAGQGQTPEQYEATVTKTIDRVYDLVQDLPHWRGRGVPMDVTEAYVTPGDIGHPELDEAALGPWRAAALRGAMKSKARLFLVYGLQPSDIQGDKSAWFKYGGWAPTLAEFKG